MLASCRTSTESLACVLFSCVAFQLISLSRQRLSAHLTNLLVKMELAFLTTGGVMVKRTVSITLMRQNLQAVVSVKAGFLFKVV